MIEMIGYFSIGYLCLALVLSAFSIRYILHNFKSPIGFLRFLDFVISQPLIWLQEIAIGLRDRFKKP